MTPETSKRRTIEIIVSSDGQLILQTHGFGGPSCRDASRFIEQALGQRLSEEATPEFYQSQVQDERANQST